MQLFGHSTLEWIMPVVVAFAFISLMSLIKEPNRRAWMAIIVGGAGSAYLSGGAYGRLELPFVAVMTVCAYKGLQSYRYIGVGWLLHTAWDVLHHLNGHPLLPFDPTSSFGCAVCDPVIAAWCFAGAPSIVNSIRRTLGGYSSPVSSGTA
jgi:hypothetical protein